MKQVRKEITKILKNNVGEFAPSCVTGKSLSYNSKMPEILQNHYVLAVHDIRKEADFYVEKLGFSVCNEPPGWIFVKKDNCMIMLGECSDAIAPRELGDHSYFGYLRVDDARSYYEDVQAKGVEFLSHIADKPWEMREFALRTPGGHRLTIGEWIGGE
jgi:catechol 2,3-dioxygenase-like lactoylglutathione lyase family enzyme